VTGPGVARNGPADGPDAAAGPDDSRDDAARPVVSLRPAEQGDLALLDSWRADAEHESEYGDFIQMHRRRTRTAERWDLDGLLGEDEGTLLICTGDEPVGAVQWHVVAYGPNRGSRALNLGIALTPSARGRGIGSRAQRLLADYLFAQTTTHRVEASTDITNLGEQRALEAAGFTREGVLRGAQFRRGHWHDLVSYARLRTDP
jgi:RimJ/RimL family protein N-acetyltransferase